MDDPDRDGYAGMMRSREKLRLSAVTDGQSNTILFGENLGEIFNEYRAGFNCWMFGGLVRGRGVLPWRENTNPSLPEFLLMGDTSYSSIRGFGSAHPETINFVFGDGAVRSVTRFIDLDTFYGLCGAADGFRENGKVD